MSYPMFPINTFRSPVAKIQNYPDKRMKVVFFSDIDKDAKFNGTLF